MRPHPALVRRPEPIPPAVRDRLRRWVRTALALDEEVPVSVTQLRCPEAGCAPVETVLAVLLPGAPLHRTLPLPAELVSVASVEDAFAGAAVRSGS
ncbi:nitrate reductase [Geodermatophilus sp. DSM 44513]|uniref:nitrate reductase n=1 Tax=Geodermatophilus sp. DSM 44513 TaxID=1528104 RepID=UPI00127C4F11|nr:nitrate reductase [Geodermatophilus sp. DSM 44513]WNV76975.1 hypothetical protein RTG05_06785 [Geodermatophilus sp. DSM 44513]